jgi:hypothetical protein
MKNKRYLLLRWSGGSWHVVVDYGLDPLFLTEESALDWAAEEEEEEYQHAVIEVTLPPPPSSRAKAKYRS